MLAVPQQKKDSVKYSSSDLVINKFNRYYSLPFGTNIDTVSFICLVPLHRRKNFENFVLSNRSNIPAHFILYYELNIIIQKNNIKLFIKMINSGKN